MINERSRCMITRSELGSSLLRSSISDMMMLTLQRRAEIVSALCQQRAPVFGNFLKGIRGI